jgi:hypothetical protein
LRLYHRTNFNLLRYFVFLILPLTFWGCSAPQVTQGLITVIISADNNELRVKITSGSTVQEALKTAQISLNDLDRVEPSLFTILSEESLVRVIRVKE